ncbi:DNA-3-methyladenine glycosylase family protein [Falsirhodobacter xinxiangensis]|uniref:DNA-3-methyladenine glycosylase family protein n=1 Tax=Falsirhodobacter xinxiangensis TaxID=2530049 RepID=UPI0010A9BC88|nr:DNA-3-methyladenine glycosylase [Rhodobacter xinxiangensis]
MAGRIIRSDECIAEGATVLIAVEPRFAVIRDIPLRLRPDGFGALLDAILSQQVSVASATAIRSRLAAAGIATEADVVAAGEEGLRACGFSRPKIRYALALASAGIDFDALRDLDDDALVAALAAQPGIGRWTAEIYAIFALGRADMFPAGDLALQEAARCLFALERRPTERELRAMSLAWSPWRAVAARMLFAYYRSMKSREGIS